MDPAYGSAELEALRREVQRLGQAREQLGAGQAALAGQLERAVLKREAITHKVCALRACAACMCGRVHAGD